MTLSTLLRYQFGYAFMGISYNILSIVLTMGGGRPLSATPPAIGIATMLIYALFVAVGFTNKLVAYRALMLIAVLVFGWGGVYAHLANFAEIDTLYHSTGAWIAAIAINLFGLALNIFAVSNRFTAD